MPVLLERLDGLVNLGDTPRCQVVWWFTTLCEKPSSWRIASQCTGCPDRSIIFICNECKNLGVLRGFICNLCRSPRGIDGYM